MNTNDAPSANRSDHAHATTTHTTPTRGRAITAPDRTLPTVATSPSAASRGNATTRGRPRWWVEKTKIDEAFVGRAETRSDAARIAGTAAWILLVLQRDPLDVGLEPLFQLRTRIGEVDDPRES